VLSNTGRVIRGLRAGVAAVILSLPGAGMAQSYPSKPIRLILSISGAGDLTARSLGERMSQNLGQPFLVEIQSGAGGAQGATAVARSAPDGQTLLFSSTSAMIMRQFLVKDMPYDTLRDFIPVARVGEAIAAVIVSADFPANTFAELIDYAKRNPGKVSYSTTGIGTTHHLSGYMIGEISNVSWVHVPYKSGPQAVQDLLGGRTPVSIGTIGTFKGMVQAGKARVVAINNTDRFSEMPGVPTVGEALPGYDRPQGWMAYFSPAGVPMPVVKRVEGEIIKAANEPAIKAKLLAAGIVVETLGSEGFTASIRREIAATARIVKAAGIQPE
jgi:tripartite-type tricarboxylate transporter receptor subunit TctC